MGELINGRMAEAIKDKILWCCSAMCCGECKYDADGDFCSSDTVLKDALALIERLEAERDAAILDLKAISHCYTCSNRDLDDNGVCKNSGGGGAPFMQCPGYVWDKKLPEPPEEDT